MHNAFLLFLLLFPFKFNILLTEHMFDIGVLDLGQIKFKLFLKGWELCKI